MITNHKISKDGLRINRNGTTIKDRKPYLKLMSNHIVFNNPPYIIFNVGTAFRDKDTGKLRESRTTDYGTKRKVSKHNTCSANISLPKKMHRNETFKEFGNRRKKSNKIRRENEKNVK